MSISFTPSQLFLITDAISVASFADGSKPDSISYSNVRRAFVFGPGKFYLKLELAVHRTQTELNEVQDEITRQLEIAILRLVGAYCVFQDTVETYQASGCKLSQVRKDHRKLIDTLAPFTD